MEINNIETAKKFITELDNNHGESWSVSTDDLAERFVEYANKFKRKYQKEETLQSRCIEIYKQWCFLNSKEFDFNGLQGKSLKSLLAKIRISIENKYAGISRDEQVQDTFQIILDYLPDWYKENNFSLSVINSKYASIISQIKSNGKSTRKKVGYTNDELDQELHRQRSEG